jgi:hypothetical protein
MGIKIGKMTGEQQKRAKVLIQAAIDILEQCENSPYVLDALQVTATWDDTECDGSCLLEEMKDLLVEIDERYDEVEGG